MCSSLNTELCFKLRKLFPKNDAAVLEEAQLRHALFSYLVYDIAQLSEFSYLAMGRDKYWVLPNNNTPLNSTK